MTSQFSHTVTLRTERPAWTARPQVTNGHPLLSVINHSAIRLVRHLRRQLLLQSYIGNSIRRARLDGQVESPNSAIVT